ncbi:MAG: DUF86 domain-containing protein [Candidatus Rokubacteria bacterium]|nr:DUF86 domain-containing protein [Candidatus Rokubacteria bacterium]
MIDRDRLLAKLDELDGYLGELRSIAPERFEEYLGVEKKRACERLVQVSVEAVIDACALLVAGLRLGLPGDEDDLFDKLARRGVISHPMADTLRRMKGLRNLHQRLGDFDAFRREILAFLRERFPAPDP